MSKEEISLGDMCKVIADADIFETKLTADQIFNYSPTGELFMIFEWYAVARAHTKEVA